MKVGLISDTHGLVRPEALRALGGSDAIVHAGDVGGPHVLEALEAVAQVHAIRGNVDLPEHLRAKRRARVDPDWAARLPDRLTLELAGARLHVVHSVADLQIDPRRQGVDVVVSGHSHAPLVERQGGVLYVNPGSAGPRRFHLPVSVGRLHLEEGEPPRAELVDL